MVTVKTEPHSGMEPRRVEQSSKENLFVTPQGGHKNNKKGKLSYDRPRPVDQPVSTRLGHENERSRVDFSDYIISTPNMFPREVQQSKNNDSSPVMEQQFIKSEPIDKFIISEHDDNNNTTNTNSIDKKRKRSKLESTNIKGKVSLTKFETQNLNNHKNDISSPTTNFTSQNKRPKIPSNVPLPINPEPFIPVKTLLYDREDFTDNNDNNHDKELLFNELFDNMEPNDDLNYCKQIVTKSLNEWIKEGEVLTNENKCLIKQLIKARLELSYKFQIITNIMNQRVESLLIYENHLDGKLKQIKTIAKNMLDIL